MSKTPSPRNTKLAAALSALTVAVASSWIADGVKGECLFAHALGACEGSALGGLDRVLFAGVLFGLAVAYLYRLAKRLLPVKHLAWAPGVRPHRVLIAALSPLAFTLREVDGRIEVEGSNREGKSFRVALSGDISCDIDAIPAAWRWPGQQFLRALRPHLLDGRLEHLVLIVSKLSGGSEALRDDVKGLIAVYPGSVEVHIDERPVNFEDIETLQTRFDEWIQHFLEAGVAEPDIILDATGGQKTTSIAAALTTLRWNRIEFQYVQTQPPNNVLGFNLAVDTGPRGAPF